MCQALCRGLETEQKTRSLATPCHCIQSFLETKQKAISALGQKVPQKPTRGRPSRLASQKKLPLSQSLNNRKIKRKEEEEESHIDITWRMGCWKKG